MAKEKIISVFDLETDPFKHGRIPKPFCLGFASATGEYADFWGDNCIEQWADMMKEKTDPHLIYAHNGGKFDFWFLYELGLLENPVKIIGSRIVSARLGIHELRDSFAIIPVALSKYKKDDIDYNKMERETRNRHKREILDYMRGDCLYTLELVTAFVQRFGPKLTIGATAIEQLMSLHQFQVQNERHDTRFRPFYFGGRTQFFESGKLAGKWKVYDVNSMYPAVMKNTYHPCGSEYITTTDKTLLTPSGHLRDYPEDWPFFIEFEGYSDGACPLRFDNGLHFPKIGGAFRITSHELQTGLKHGLIRIDHVFEILIPSERIRFNDFVDLYIGEKIEAKKRGDKISELFSKLIANSSYGKTAQNPENFFDYQFRQDGDDIPDLEEWELFLNAPRFEVWRRPSTFKKYFDVAIGASITGAARAVLLDALSNATRPVYCDTDSIICESLQGVDIDPYELGAWDKEAEGDTIYIAGKKLYALFKGGECIKQASKGVRLSASEIKRVAQGESVKWVNHAPSFKLDKNHIFIERNIKMRC